MPDEVTRVLRQKWNRRYREKLAQDPTRVALRRQKALPYDRKRRRTHQAVVASSPSAVVDPTREWW